MEDSESGSSISVAQAVSSKVRAQAHPYAGRRVRELTRVGMDTVIGFRLWIVQTAYWRFLVSRFGTVLLPEAPFDRRVEFADLHTAANTWITLMDKKENWKIPDKTAGTPMLVREWKWARNAPNQRDGIVIVLSLILRLQY